MTSELTFVLEPGGVLRGTVKVPGDKSISHRSVMLGALAEGTTEITGLLEGEDVLCTLAAFRAMGVRADGPRAGALTIHGVGMHGLQPPRAVLDMGNSGTAMRLMCGILAGQRFDSELTGDSSLCKRPMGRVATPLNAMGAAITTQDQGRPPLKIAGGRQLRGIDYVLPVASAQVKSAILLAGLYADGVTAVTEPAPTRDHTERMLRGFGYDVSVAGARAQLQGGGRLYAKPIAVPADISSAAFFMVGASIAAGSDVMLTHVGMNPTRIGVINILRLMGAQIAIRNERTVGGEPVADISITGARLHGIAIPAEQVPLAIDEFPAIFIAAACADGETVLTGAEELRVKESDRIAVMAQGLRALNVEAHETPDGIRIRGRADTHALAGGVVASHGDHRIAMSFAMAALRAQGAITVQDCKNVATSFPGFAELAAGAGLRIHSRS